MRISLKSLAVPIVFALLIFVALLTERNALFGKGVVEVKEHPNRHRTLIFAWYDDVKAPMAQRFEEAFDAHAGDADTIILDFNSKGGSLREGQRVIEWIKRAKRTHRIESQVQKRRSCLSMCVPIYLQGQLRRASGSSRWMFHEPRLVDAYTNEIADQPEFEKNWSSNRFFERYFVNSEMDPDWRERLREKWVGKDVWYSGRDLVEQHSGVVQELM